MDYRCIMNLEESINEEIEEKQSIITSMIKKEKKDATLKNVYDTFSKYLHITDFDRLDVILATVLSNELPGTPIWMFITGESGDWKTTAVKGLKGWKNVKTLDKITPKTLASGKNKVKDLGSELADTSTILLFFDMATMSGIDKSAKAEIWTQFRNLYDGYIDYQTGSGVERKYNNCHVTFLGCSTDSLKNEILLNAQLGTRELMYDTSADVADNDAKMDAALENEEYEQEMYDDIQESIHRFLRHHHVDRSIGVSSDIKSFIKKEAQRITVLRANQATDYKHGELINRVRPEVPTRVVKQLKRIYMCLKSLDKDYPDEKARRIISHIVDSTGNEVRQRIMKMMQKKAEEWYTVEDIRHGIRIGRDAVKRQMEMLWSMEVVDMRIEERNIGGWSYVDDFGVEQKRGGRWVETCMYMLTPDWRIAKQVRLDV